jgi:hypothetical protein
MKEILLLFSIIEALSIINSLLKVRKVIKIFVWWFEKSAGCRSKKVT